MPSAVAQLIGFTDIMQGFEQLLDDVGGEPTWVVGTDTAYGVYLEFGTSKMQAYPWLRPAVEEFEANPGKFIAQHAGTSVDAFSSTDELVAAIALALESRAKDNVSAGKESDRSPGTDPAHPERQSGNLAGSIEAVKVV